MRNWAKVSWCDTKVVGVLFVCFSKHFDILFMQSSPLPFCGFHMLRRKQAIDKRLQYTLHQRFQVINKILQIPTLGHLDTQTRHPTSAKTRICTPQQTHL